MLILKIGKQVVYLLSFLWYLYQQFKVKSVVAATVFTGERKIS